MPKLKKIVATLEGLEAYTDVYVKQADGKFHLDVEDDDGEELKRAKEHEKGLRIIAERDLATANETLRLAQAEVGTLKSQASQGVQELRNTLTTEWQKKLDDQKTEHDKEMGGLQGTIKKVFVSDVASRIASEIALDEGAAELLTNSIAARLQVEIVNGEPLTRVLQADGKPSSMTPDQLKNEYFTNEKYAGIMRASDASGSGASGSKKKAGGPQKLEDLGDKERTEMSKNDPVGFKRLQDEYAARVNVVP